MTDSGEEQRNHWDYEDYEDYFRALSHEGVSFIGWDGSHVASPVVITMDSLREAMDEIRECQQQYVHLPTFEDRQSAQFPRRREGLSIEGVSSHYVVYDEVRDAEPVETPSEVRHLAPCTCDRLSGPGVRRVHNLPFGGVLWGSVMYADLSLMPIGGWGGQQRIITILELPGYGSNQNESSWHTGSEAYTSARGYYSSHEHAVKKDDVDASDWVWDSWVDRMAHNWITRETDALVASVERLLDKK